METDAYMTGVKDGMQKLSQAVEANDRAIKSAFEWILLQLVNYAKHFGPWTDRTGNLRNSISVNIRAMREVPAGQNPGSPSEHEKPVIRVEGDDYIGVLSAGMEYAIWVERTQGYWVLTGAIDKFEPLLEKYFKGFLTVEKLDLEHAATMQYARIRR